MICQKKISIFDLLIFLLIVCGLNLSSVKNVSGQKLVQDTLSVSFKDPDFEKLLPLSLDTVIDARAEPSFIIGRYEKNRYWFIPVDLLIRTEKPLNHEVRSFLDSSCAGDDSRSVKLIVDDFFLSKNTNSRLFPHYRLNASIRLYQRDEKNEEPVLLGDLVYDSVFRKPFFRDDLKRGYETVMSRWQDQLLKDLEIISVGYSKRTSPLHNLRPNSYDRRNKNMYCRVDVSRTGSSWIYDSRLFFAFREANRLTVNNGYALRYRKNERYDTIEYCLSNENIIFRLNNRSILEGSSNIFFGLNRWNDLEGTEHKIYDAFIFDFSIKQSLTYNPLDKRSLILGFGLHESLLYIYSKGFHSEIGLTVHLGIKI